MLESRRSDSLFEDPLAEKLAGEASHDAMGAWILVPRTRFGDDLLRNAYATKGCRQLVLLGAGFDARAYRMDGMPELRVFEVDQQTTFDVKEPLLEGERLLVESRAAVGTDFSASVNGKPQWAKDLVETHNFDPAVPSVWLLEGLLMYLSMPDTHELMRQIGALSATNSVVFHDAISATYLTKRIQVAGAPFIGASDVYGELWGKHAGFLKSRVHDFS